MEMKTKMREQHLGGSVKNDKWITDVEESRQTQMYCQSFPAIMY